MFTKIAVTEDVSVVTPQQFIRDVYGNLKMATQKELKYADFLVDPIGSYVLSHSTIIPSVNVEADKEYLITPETAQFVNKNGDAWERRLLASTYQTFVGKPNYVNHVQIAELSVGTVLDAVAIAHDDSLYVHLLVATHRKHSIAKRIIEGSIHAMSMGADVQFTICTKCGNVAETEESLCEHILYERGRQFNDEAGRARVVAELCGHHTRLDSNVFVEASWVEDPAFIMAQTHATLSVPENVFTMQDTLPPTQTRPATIELRSSKAAFAKAAATKKVYQAEDFEFSKTSDLGQPVDVDIPIDDEKVWANLPITEYPRQDDNFAWPNDPEKPLTETEVLLSSDITALLKLDRAESYLEMLGMMGMVKKAHTKFGTVTEENVNGFMAQFMNLPLKAKTAITVYVIE